MRLKNGDIICHRADYLEKQEAKDLGTFYGKAIAWFDRVTRGTSKYTHVEVYHEGTVIGALGDDGVEVRPFFYNRHHHDVYRVLNWKPTGEEGFIRDLNKRLGKAYSPKGIIQIAAHRLGLQRFTRNQPGYFCSELVSECLHRNAWVNLPKQTWMIEPSDFPFDGLILVDP